jgi:hypothetical protein
MYRTLANKSRFLAYAFLDSVLITECYREDFLGQNTEECRKNNSNKTGWKPFFNGVTRIQFRALN